MDQKLRVRVGSDQTDLSQELRAWGAFDGEVSRQLVDGHAPQLFVVGLEEVLVEAPSESSGDPPFEGRLIFRRVDARPHVRRHAEERLPDAEVPERVRRLQRVVVVLTLVVDAAHSWPKHEVFVGQDLVPEGLDLFDLGEEAMAADVETPTVSLDGAADASDDGIGLDDG